METERLILRKLTENDAEKMFENWTNDEEVCRYLTRQFRRISFAFSISTTERCIYFAIY